LEDQEAIQRTLAGDQSAFQYLVEKYQYYVFSVTLNILKKREEAEEAAQDVFLKAYKTLESFRGNLVLLPGCIRLLTEQPLTPNAEKFITLIL